MKSPTLALALALAAPLPAAALTNGSFEAFPTPLTQGSNQSWDHFTAISGWSTGAGELLEIQSNDTLSYIDAEHGTHYAELDSTHNATIYQDTTLTAGTYALSFWYAARDRTEDVFLIGPPPADTSDMTFGVAGLFTQAVTPTAAFGTWTQITTQFTVATTGTYRLNFTGTGTSDSYGALIDNVQLAPVPLPATGLLLLAALGTAALRRNSA